MGKIQIFKAGTSFLWKAPNKTVRTESVRYATECAEKPFATIDEFVRKTTVTNPSTLKAENLAKTSAKKVTQRDQELVHSYLQYKKYEIPVTKAEIDELLKYDGDELVDKGVDFVLRKLNIPQSLKPAIISVPQDKEIGMAYEFRQNLLLLNPNFKTESKAELLGFLVHELRHMSQSFDILRTEGLGEEFVRANARKLAKLQIANLKQIVKKCSIEDYKKMTPNEQAQKEFQELKELKAKDKVKSEENYVILTKMVEEHFTKIIEQLRQNVTSKLGVIKADSKQGQRAKKYFKSFMTNYRKKDGTIHTGKYNLCVTEREALDLGFAFEERVKNIDNSEFCFLKFAKNYERKHSDDPIREKQIDMEIQELEQKINEMSWKDYLRYMYD